MTARPGKAPGPVPGSLKLAETVARRATITLMNRLLGLTKATTQAVRH